MQNLDEQSSVVGAKYKPTDPESSTKPKQGGHKKQLRVLNFSRGKISLTGKQTENSGVCLLLLEILLGYMFEV